ncbi:hypothetical protein ABVT39_006962, partial [Epinephelus coioides]
MQSGPCQKAFLTCQFHFALGGGFVRLSLLQHNNQSHSVSAPVTSSPSHLT